MSHGKRIYAIRIEDEATGLVVGLVRANSPASALMRHVRGVYRADVASQDDLVDGLTKGLKVADTERDLATPDQQQIVDEFGEVQS